ncbi:transport protein particle complex of the golgi, subunit bet5-like protein [Chytriomyces sp. MP71]|nr:transport protein particle complex of the golgi, subunit bet5-like protein [Chytriomyces sp. MP71]
MTIYSIHIFNKKCEGIFYSEWNTPNANAYDADENGEGRDVDGDPEMAKLVYGVVFSLRNMVDKMSVGKGASDGFLSYKTSTYKLHYFGSLAGPKFVLITDPNCPNMTETLKSVYAKLYVEFVVKNPLAKPNTPIKNALFRSNLDKFIRAMPNFE